MTDPLEAKLRLALAVFIATASVTAIWGSVKGIGSSIGIDNATVAGMEIHRSSRMINGESGGVRSEGGGSGDWIRHDRFRDSNTTTTNGGSEAPGPAD